MSRHLAGAHLWNAALLAAAVMIALVADRLSAAGTRQVRPAASGPDAGPFVTPVAVGPGPGAAGVVLASDPFRERPGMEDVSGVAPGASRPTVPSAAPGGRSLTAILVADERRVAVIDDETVTVGATLSDGARVAAILPDRVWVVERNGRRHMLTLMRGQ